MLDEESHLIEGLKVERQTFKVIKLSGYKVEDRGSSSRRSEEERISIGLDCSAAGNHGDGGFDDDAKIANETEVSRILCIELDPFVKVHIRTP